MTEQQAPGQIIHAKLLDRIRNGTYGERLPTMRALAGEFQVNLKTIQKVIGRLRDEGLVLARQGSAVYVRLPGERTSLKRKPRRGRPTDLTGTKIGFVCDGYGRVTGAGPHPYFSELLRGAMEAAADEGLDLSFLPTPGWGHLGEDEAFFRQRVLEAGLRGVISLTPTAREVERYVANGIRFVICGDHVKLPPMLASARVPRLFHPWDEAVGEGARRLIAARHRRIAFLGRKGLAGFEAALGAYGLEVPAAWRQRAAADAEETGYVGAQRLLDEPIPPTAMLVTDDFTCRGVLMALLERRIETPGSLSLLTLANAASDLHLLRPVSTLEVDGRREGWRYVRVLARELRRGPKAPSERDRWPLPPRFTDRGSIGPPGGEA
ncbi:MAG: hypothetical protein AMXMBFR7_45990 [Planctomycetota bacterium]